MMEWKVWNQMNRLLLTFTLISLYSLFFLGRGAIGGNDVWYHHKEFFLFSSFPSFLFLFRSPKGLSATSTALSATFIILPAAFEALPAAFEDLSATS